MYLTESTPKTQFSREVLENMLDDLRFQPSEWRALGDRCDDYYDNKQGTPEMLADLKKKGQPFLPHNLIAPAIDGVLGMEAKHRTDWAVTADDDEGLDVAEALDVKLNEVARLSRAKRASADAYASQVKAGLGWVEVGRNDDPFKYRYRCRSVHRREMFWDWHSEDPGLEDARWLLRRKYFDVDELKFAFPRHAELIDQIASGWRGAENWEELEHIMASPNLQSAYEDTTTTRMELAEWWDSDRKRALVYEVYYRVFERKPVLKLSDGRAVLYDQNNRFHIAALNGGHAEVVHAPYTRMRQAFFIGPHRVLDRESPHPHNRFPYVPFWGFRESNTGAPYGLIRRMLPAQDEINFRRSKLTWILNKVTVTKDSDAVLAMSDDALVDEVYRTDSVITLNEHRKNVNGFSIDWGMGNIAQQQFQVMQEAQNLIQDTAGIYSAFLGQEGGAKSGVAIDSLVEQGTTTLGELNDNYRFARQLVGELLLANIVDDISDQEIQVKINVNGPDKLKTVVLNERAENGEVNNRVLRVKTHVEVQDITSTPGYRRAVADRMMSTIGSLPPEYQAAMAELVIEMTDIPADKRDKMLKKVAQITGQGIDPEDMTPEQQAEMQRKQELQQRIESLNLEEMELKVQELAAKIRNLDAKSSETETRAPADQAKTLEEIKEIRAKVKEILTRVYQGRQDIAMAAAGQLNAGEQRRTA